MRFQFNDLSKKPMSPGEFDSVLRAVGGLDALVDWDGKSRDLGLLRYLADRRQQEDLVFENQKLLRQPVVRNGRQATVGYCPDVWKGWQEG